MIQIKTEALIRIHQVPKLLPRQPNGKRVHISAVYRWVSRGVHGVKLEAVKIGGATYTSEEALQRFAERLSQPNSESSRAIPKTWKQRRVERAAVEAKRIVGLSTINVDKY